MDRRINVLLIDDESDYSETMGFYLKSKGHRVRTADSGAKGLEEIRRELPEVVFLDFLMPGMNGVETLRGIREISPALPVIMVTAYAQAELVLEAAALGITAVFPKAEDFSQAAVLINKALSEG